MKTLKELVSEFEKILESILSDSGSIVFSSSHTIKKGVLYTLGLNPGGEAEIPIRKVLYELPSKTRNAYLDEKWGNRKNSSYDIGQHPLQKNYVGLLKALGHDPRSVFSSNLIFSRSRGQKGANYSKNADICWPVHQEFIKIVDPDHFIVFGNSKISPYQYIKTKYNLQTSDSINSGHGNWKCHYATGEIEGRERLVVGVPHLSRYFINYHREVIDWISLKIT